MLVFAMSAALGACTTGGNEEGKEVTVKWVMAGPGELADSQKVWQAFNEKLQEYLPGITVEFDVYPRADYKQKVTLMQAAGEKMDIVNVYGLNYGDELRKGSFADITDIIAEHGQDMYNELPEALWDYMKYKDRIYAVPSYQQMSNSSGFMVPKALADKYLDKEALINDLRTNKTITSSTLDIVESYLKNLKDNGEIGYGFNFWVDITGKGFDKIVDYYAIRQHDDKCKVELLFETPEIKEYYARKADWYKKGYIRSDSLSAQDDQTGKEGGYVMWQETTGYKSGETASAKYGMEIECIDYNPDNPYYIPTNYTAMGTAVASSSDHKEEAVKVLNLINSEKGKELINMLVYGIEGDHYTVTGEDKIQTEYNGQVTSNERYGLYKWIVGNTKYVYDTQTDLEGYKSWVFDEVNQSQNLSKLIGFVPDTSKIATQLSQVLAVKGEYFSGLMSGALPDEEAVYNEFIDKLNKAGNQEIIAELQRQIDEFLASK